MQLGVSNCVVRLMGMELYPWCCFQGLKTRNEALRKFQLRVLALVEIWAKKQSDSALVALVPVPLLRALRIASRPSGHPPLAHRLEHVLKKQIAACRPIFAPSLAVDGLATPEDAEQRSKLGSTGLEQVMARVMYFATRESDTKVLSAATASYSMLLRGVISAEQRGGCDSPAAAAMHGAVAAIVQEVFDKRKSRWSFENVAAMLKAMQDVLPVLLLPPLLEKVSTARTDFLRIEALRLCTVCLRCDPDTAGRVGQSAACAARPCRCCVCVLHNLPAVACGLEQESARLSCVAYATMGSHSVQSRQLTL